MEQPLISVIIPVYNMDRYLERCLDSILGNTYKNLEIICVDDGSKDKSLEILRHYEAYDSRITVISKENGGVSTARNIGLEHITGDYISFVDSDDYLHPQFFELLYGAIQITGSDVAASRFQRVYEDTSVQMKEYTLSERNCSVLGLRQACKSEFISFGCCFKLVPRWVIEQTRFKTDFSYGEDTIFFLELWEKSPSLRFVVYNNDLYFYYRDRADSLASSNRERYIMPLLAYLRQKAASKETERIYLEPSIRRCLYFRYHFTHVQKNNTLRKEINRLTRGQVLQLLRSKNYSLRVRLGLTLLILSPGYYRHHTIGTPLFCRMKKQYN